MKHFSMNHFQWIIILSLVFVLSCCSSSDEVSSDKSSNDGSPNSGAETANHAGKVTANTIANLDPSEQVFAPINAKPGEYTKPLGFDTVIIDMQKMPGTLPIPAGSKKIQEAGDRYIKSITYAGLAKENISKIHGFIIEKQYPPVIVQGFTGFPLKKIKVTLSYGDVSEVDFGQQGPPPVPTKQPIFGEIRKTADGDQEIVPPKNKPTTKKAAGLTEVFSKTFVLRPDNKQQYWQFIEPIVVYVKFNQAFQLTLEILLPANDPTQPLLEPDFVHLAISDEQRISEKIELVSPIIDDRQNACYGNPKKKVFCLYASGVAEFYFESPFVDISSSGSWKRRDNTLFITFDKENSIEIDVSDPILPISLGKFDKGFVKLKGQKRGHPYYDLASKLAGKTPFSVDDINLVYRTQIISGGTDEIIVEIKTGGVAVFNRPDKFSSLSLMKRFEATKDARVRVVYVPTSVSTFFGIKEPSQENWSVHGFIKSANSWAGFPRREVPWKTWTPDIEQNYPAENTKD